MASRKIEDLKEELQSIARQFKELMEKEGINFIFTCTYRSNEEQEALYAQGREPLQTVNELRKKVNLPPLTEKENRIVTYAKPGQSKHNIREAFDIAIMEAGKIVWDATHPHWKRAGELGKSLGLKWAGDWKKFKEYPHFEI